MPIDPSRLDMPIGDAMFSQRSIRRFRADPISTAHIQLLLEAAAKAPSGGNRQPVRFVVLTDPRVTTEFGDLYREAWWAKRRDEKRPWTTRDEIPAEDRGSVAAARLADEIKDAPCIVLALSTGTGQASSVIPGVQNLMLAARALGIGSVPTTLHPQVLERVYALLGIPSQMDFHLCIPLGYPRGRFGPTQRKPTAETTSWNRWGVEPPWAAENDPPTTAGGERDAALGAFDERRIEFEAAVRGAPDAALRYRAPGEDYALGGLIVHVTQVLRHYTDVLQAIHTADWQAPKAPPNEPSEADAALIHDGFGGDRRASILSQMREAHVALVEAVRAEPADWFDRQAPVTYSGSSAPFPTSPADVVGWVRDHYVEHTTQIGQLVSGWAEATR